MSDVASADAHRHAQIPSRVSSVEPKGSITVLHYCAASRATWWFVTQRFNGKKVFESFNNLLLHDFVSVFHEIWGRAVH